MPRLLGVTLLMTVSWNASSEVRSSMLQSFLSLIFLIIMLARMSHESYVLLEVRRYLLGDLSNPVFLRIVRPNTNENCSIC
jgi:hypothetical protein